MGSVKRDMEVALAYSGGAVCGNGGRWVCARWRKDTGATRGSTRDSEATRGSIGDFGVARGDAGDFRATRGNTGDDRAMWGNTEVLELCVA